MPGNDASLGMATPPEGVISGESIRERENELDDRERQAIETLVGTLKDRGEPYISITDEELRSKATDILVDDGVVR